MINTEYIRNGMKTKALKSIVLAAISLLFVLPAISQKGIEDGSKYGKGKDSINCIKNLSLYKEFFKHNNYRDAIDPWRNVFSECPASSERISTLQKPTQMDLATASN